MFSRIKTVTIFRPNGVAVYEIGQKLIINEKPSDIVVENIKQQDKECVSISFSNGEEIVFFGLPYALSFKK